MLIVGVTNWALGAPWLRRLAEEGYDVKMWVKESARYGDVYSGLIERVADWHTLWDEADMFFFDDTTFGVEQDDLREEGKFVFGGSSFGDEIELDRAKGLELAKKMNVRIPPTWEFNDFDEAIDFLSRERIPAVIKFMGELDFLKSWNYVSRTEDSRDLIELMKFYKRKWSSIANTEPKFVIQQRIDGVEVAVGAFHNGRRFMLPICVNFEHKHYRAEGVGPLTGEEGTVAKFEYDNTYLFDLSLRRAEADFAQYNNVGYVDVNGIFNDEGYWFLEFTARLGYPISYMQLYMLTRDGRKLGDFFTAVREQEDMFDVGTEWFVGVVVSVPPYPADDVQLYKLMYKGMPVIVDEKYKDNFVWSEVALDNDTLVTAGADGYVGVAVASDKYLSSAIRKVYRVLRHQYIPQASYRKDIGQRVVDNYAKLLRWGVI